MQLQLKINNITQTYLWKDWNLNEQMLPTLFSQTKHLHDKRGPSHFPHEFYWQIATHLNEHSSSALYFRVIYRSTWCKI